MFAFTANDRWVPGIGDPTVGGWLTVLAYFGAAWLCWRAARAGNFKTQAGGVRWFWIVFCSGLVLLGVNKQLDLQTWFTLTAKRLALNDGWYLHRRFLQAGFISVVAVGGIAGLFGLRALAGRMTLPIVVALCGGIFLGCFILIRASSFHHVDQMLGMNLGGIKVNWILELGSIGCIGAAALMHRRAQLVGSESAGQNFVWVSAGDRLNKREG